MGIPVREIKGIGEKTEKLLARLEIETVDQLVHHYPRCYTTYPEPIAIADIKTGQRCSVEAEISSPIHLKTVRKLKLCTGLIADVSRTAFVRWFNMPIFRNTLKQGERWIFTGLQSTRMAALCSSSRNIVKKEKYIQLMETFQPIYPLTTGLSIRQCKKHKQQHLKCTERKNIFQSLVQSIIDLEPVDKAL